MFLRKFSQHSIDMFFRYGMAHIGRVGSVVLTLSISIERYCSVCHSTCHFRAKSLLLPIPIAFAILYNVPKFFELKSETIYEFPPILNYNTSLIMPMNSSNSGMNSLSNYRKADSSIDQLNDSYQDSDIIPHNYTMPEPESSVIIVGTDLRRNPWYILIYLFWSKFLLVEIVPYFLMVVMNVLIWRKIQEFARVRSTTLGMNAGTIGIQISSNSFYVYLIQSLF